jgi:thiol-disulfide isomerase/thioredoxin
MRTIKLFIVILTVTFATSCNAQSSTKKETIASSTDKIEVYYFHFTSRCVTCKTVEAEAKKDIETLYPEQVKSDKITFQAINLDESSSKEIAEKLGVSGQTLLIVKGDQKINITNEGFMNARNNPDKFKEIIKEKIDKLM